MEIPAGALLAVTQEAGFRAECPAVEGWVGCFELRHQGGTIQ